MTLLGYTLYIVLATLDSGLIRVFVTILFTRNVGARHPVLLRRRKNELFPYKRVNFCLLSTSGEWAGGGNMHEKPSRLMGDVGRAFVNIGGGFEGRGWLKAELGAGWVDMSQGL